MIIIKSFSHVLISGIKTEYLSGAGLALDMQGYSADDNIVVYDKLCFWL